MPAPCCADARPPLEPQARKGRKSRARVLLLLGAAPMQTRVGRQSSVKQHEVSSGSAGSVGTAVVGGEEEHRLE
eukprot:6886452-Pyramimonas_sp.AAC.1